METIYSKWLADLMERHGIKSQYKLEQLSGVPQPTIQRIAKGKTLNPKGETLRILAESLGEKYDPGEIGGDKPGPGLMKPNARVVTGTITSLPILTLIQAGKLCENPAWQHPSECEPYETAAKVGPRAYALRVKGDSMTNPYGTPTIPDGFIVVVDPDVPAEPGKIVVAKIKNQEEATLKMLVKDGPKYFLKALNPAYPMFEIDDSYIICAVAVSVGQKL